MQLKVEGLILSKIPYRDKDLICKILMRNGKKISVLFYNFQNSPLELGLLTSLTLRYRHSNGGEGLYVAKEWAHLWYHKKIRYHATAYSVACFFLETVEKVSTLADLHADLSEHEFQGLFRVTSNGLFYLEQSLSQSSSQSLGHTLMPHLVLFLSKLLWEMGVAPNLHTCLFCEHPLQQTGVSSFIYTQGGFSCPHCDSGKNEREISQGILSCLLLALKTKYTQHADFTDQLKALPSANSQEKIQEIIKRIFNFFCYQFHLDQKKFRTLRFLFSREKFILSPPPLKNLLG